MIHSTLLSRARAVVLSLCALPLVAAADVPPDQIAKIEAALPTAPVAKPAKARKLLVFSRTRGFRHSSIAVGQKTMELLGQKTGAFTATITEDEAAFEPESLKGYDAVLMLNTTGPCFSTDPKLFEGKPNATELKAADEVRSERLRKSLAAFVENGGGLAGIHSASDTLYDSVDYGKMIGGYFDGHPWGSGDTVTVKVRDTEHPLTASFKAGGPTFDIKDEIYQLKQWDPAQQHALLGLSVSPEAKTNMTKNGIKRTDGDFAISWVKNYAKGRVYYCSLGHNEAIYWTPSVVAYYLAGIQFALGDNPVPIKNGSTQP
jgi:uncharacterized protein